MPEESLDIMLSSLSSSTRKQYKSSLKKWLDFCNLHNIEHIQPQVQDVIKYLTFRFEQGDSYGSLNSDRCAISLLSADKIEDDLLVKRFLKGCFRRRPTKSKYSFTWDVDTVFNYIDKLGPTSTLSIKNLTFKTLILLALSTAQRMQTLSKININNISFNDHKLEIRITDLIKNSRPGVAQPVLVIPRFAEKPNLCVYSCILQYIETISKIREQKQQFFLSIKKPFLPVGLQTLSRWVKSVLKNAGINTEIFSGHSTRHAAASAALARGLDVELIKKTAGWSEKSNVFARFYNREIRDESSLASTIINYKK